MKSPASLPKGAAFDTAYAKGSAVAGPFFIVRCVPNSSGVTRWGFAVGKKQWKRATDRNRIRRRLRAIAQLTNTATPLDIIVTARARSERAEFAQLVVALRRQLLSAQKSVSSRE